MTLSITKNENSININVGAFDSAAATAILSTHSAFGLTLDASVDAAAARTVLGGVATLTGLETLTNKTITNLLMTGSPRANGLSASGLGQFLTDLKLGPVFASRTEATSGTTGYTGSSNIISVKHNGRILNYIYDTTAGSILTTGDGRTWAPAGQPSIDHAGAISYTTQAAAEAGTDSSTAVQAVVDWLVSTNKSAEIDVGYNAYRLDSKITVAKSSIGFVGQGKHESVLVITHSAGDEGIRFTRDNPIFRNLGMVAGTTRAAVSFASSGTMCGIRLECEDVPDNSSLRLRNCDFEDFQIINMPSHGLVGVGAVSGTFFRGTITGSKGHNVFIATDVYPRTNVGQVPGLCIFASGENVNAKGHSFCTEPLTATTTPATRIDVINVEIGQNASDSTVRLSQSDAYFNACEVNIENCVFKPYSGNEAFYGKGINIRAINNRYGGAARIATISSGPLLQTQNVVIDGAEMFNNLASYDPLVRLKVEGGASEPVNVQVVNFWGGTVLNVKSTDGSYTPSPQTIPWLLHNNGGKLSFIKGSNQTVNNSTTLVDVSDLEMYVSPNEKIIFTCTLTYMSDTAADLRARMIGPTGSVVTFNVANSGKVGTSDAYTVQSNIDQTSQILVGSGGVAVERMLTLVGTCINGSTGGRLRAQFAQATASATDTTIVAGRSFVTFTKADN